MGTPFWPLSCRDDLPGIETFQAVVGASAPKRFSLDAEHHTRVRTTFGVYILGWMRAHVSSDNVHAQRLHEGSTHVCSGCHASN